MLVRLTRLLLKGSVDNADYKVTKIGSDRGDMDCLFTCLGQPIVAPMPQVQGGKDIMKHSYE